VTNTAIAHDAAAPERPSATIYVVGAPGGFYVKVLKPTFDRLVAGAVLLVTLPIMVLCAIAVRISLGPHIFFAQERVGHGGRRFYVYKFRTMHHDRRARRFERTDWDGEERRLTHKSEHDPRLTGVGRFLRKWSLDELPQLWNVLRGDMSIIGPRPELPLIVDSYTEWEHARHKVKPGLTGLWQVSARGTGRPMHEHVGVDIEYVAGISARLDARILARTPMALLTKRGY
jgi:lipopolysaccharide/colanic/teichoic acid biosynthesis glycosyltransferase